MMAHRADARATPEREDTHDTRDPAQLGRGPLSRWMPVVGQAAPTPPSVRPFPLAPGTSPQRFLLRVLFSAKKLTLPAAVLSIGHQVGEALVPVIAGAAIDRALSTGDGLGLAFWLAVLGLNFLMLSFSFRFSAQLSAQATEQVQHRLRVTLSRAVLHPTGHGQARPDGAVVSSMTNDVTRLAMMGLAVFPVGEFAGVVFIAVSLLLIHWPVGLAVLIGAPITVWLIGLLSGRYARASRGYQNQLAATVSQATDLVTGYRVIKGVRAEEEATERYRTASRGTLASALQSVAALGRLMVGSGMMSGVFIAGVAALAGWYAVQGEISVGGLIAAVGLAMALLPPMQMLTGNAVPLWASAVASSGRVIDLLTGQNDGQNNVRDQPRDSSAAELPDGADQYEVTVTYRRTRIELAPGELLGVRADDRTASLLAEAMLSPAPGAEVQVQLAGINAADLERTALRARMLVAPHHGTLFSGSIAENLAIGAAAADVERAPRALWAAACEDFLDAAGGLDGPTGEMGGHLSGGQRQRLALARALASDAPVLVLHDPTTAVDSVTEATIASRLPELRGGKSTLIITSSPALLSACDRVVDVAVEARTA